MFACCACMLNSFDESKLRQSNADTYFVYELVFFGMLDVVAVVFLFHSNAVRSHNVTSTHANYAAVYELFFVPAPKNDKR